VRELVQVLLCELLTLVQHNGMPLRLAPTATLLTLLSHHEIPLRYTEHLGKLAAGDDWSTKISWNLEVRQQLLSKLVESLSPTLHETLGNLVASSQAVHSAGVDCHLVMHPLLGDVYLIRIEFRNDR
jgi:hypothetical protein